VLPPKQHHWFPRYNGLKVELNEGEKGSQQKVLPMKSLDTLFV